MTNQTKTLFPTLDMWHQTVLKPLCLFINKTNGYIEDINGGKYLTLILIDESTDTLKRYEELLRKIKYQQIITQVIVMKCIWKPN